LTDCTEHLHPYKKHNPNYLSSIVFVKLKIFIIFGKKGKSWETHTNTSILAVLKWLFRFYKLVGNNIEKPMIKGKSTVETDKLTIELINKNILRHTIQFFHKTP